MASVKFSALPSASSLSGTELFCVVQGATSKQATVSQISAGWNTLTVTADRTTASPSAVDITDLVTPTLSVNTIYEIDSSLLVKTSEAGNGMFVTVQVDGTAPSLNIGYTSYANGIMAELRTNNVNVSGIYQTFVTAVDLKGLITTGTGTPVIRIRFYKPVTGTAFVMRGSLLRYRVVA
jgi:hypothetical protein